MKLFIVESPNKCGYLRKILGSEYHVAASVGHIRSIPHKGMNINISKGFVPVFEVSADKKKIVKDLKSLAEKASEIILAMDKDREGEAIAWHIYDILSKKNQKKCTRVTFTAIKPKPVLAALKDKRDIDMDLVDAQKARQVLDRLIGYTLSPLLWYKVEPKTSAGRVQSVALKLVALKEKEISAFKSTDFWYLDALLKCSGGEFSARVVTKDKDNRYLDEKVTTDEFEALKKATFKMASIDDKEKIVGAYHPFDTSSLQTTASTLFSWPIKKTAQVSQKLYEAGKVTYIRTDSYNISKEALDEVRTMIKEGDGECYLPKTANYYKKKKEASTQEAHECIRPTNCNDNGGDLSGDQQKLYKLIRERFVACQMTPMIVDTVTYNVKSSTKHDLIAKGQAIRFDGWSKVYRHISTKAEILPSSSKGESLELQDMTKMKGTTKPPPRYNEGSLVKKMEEEGVGRPSTYPSIMENIQSRGYVNKMNKKGVLQATELGIRVFDYLDKHFKDFIMDVKYTAKLESDLDVMTQGEKKYLDVVKSTYDQMMISVKKAKGEKEVIPEGTPNCLECKTGFIVKKNGRYGSFYSCNGYPKCKVIYEIDDKGKFSKKVHKKAVPSGKDCPDCKKNKRDGVLLTRTNRKDNTTFYGCSKYPKCKYTETDSSAVEATKD